MLCALGLRQSAPGRIELQERVLHEVTVGHEQPESIVKWGYPQGRSGVSTDTIVAMRIALVSPYSWTYPGGVTRHIEALREELSSLGHDVRVLAPVDPPDRRSARRHRGAVPAGARAADLAGPARPDDGLPGQRRGLQPDDAVWAERPRAARGAAHRRLRRRPPARAGRPVRRLGHADDLRRADGRHLPLLLGQRADQRDRGGDRRPSSAQPPEGPDRGLRGRRVDGRALLRRPLPRDPQRRRGVRCRWSRRRPSRSAPSARCRSRSSARPSSARACRCCCAPSRRCASTCPPS